MKSNPSTTPLDARPSTLFSRLSDFRVASIAPARLIRRTPVRRPLRAFFESLSPRHQPLRFALRAAIGRLPGQRPLARVQLFAFSSLALLAASAANAASLTWGASGAGGDGTWNVNSNVNWWNGTSNVVWPALGGTDDNAIFSGTAGTVTLGSAITAHNLLFNTTSYILSGAQTLTLNGSSPTISTANGISATIGNNTALVLAGSVGLTKAGAGNLTLSSSAVNTFTGGLNLKSGTLALDFANLSTPTDLINSGNALTLAGGRMTVKGKSSGTTSQEFAGTTLSAGGGSILANPFGGTSTTVKLGALSTSAAGGSLLVGTASSPGTGTVAFTSTTNKDATTGIYSPRVVFTSDGGTTVNWATSSTSTGPGTPNTLSALGTYTNRTGNYAGGTDTNNSRIQNNNSVTLNAADWTTNSLKIEASTASKSLALGSYKLTLTSGGLLFTGNQQFTISGTAGATRLTAGAGSNYDLLVQNYGTNNIVSAVIGDNGGNAVSLTLAGPASNSFNLSGVNTFTGATYINAGRLSIAAANYLGGTSGVYVANGGQLNLNGSFTFAKPIEISGFGFTEANGVQFGAIRAASSSEVSNTVTLAGDARIGKHAGGAATVSGQITGGYAIDFFGTGDSASDANTLTLSNTANNYTGDTSISFQDYGGPWTGGSTTLKLGASNVLPDGAGKGNLVFNGADANHKTILDLAGFNETVNGLSNAAAAGSQILNSSATASTLTVGANDTTTTFSGLIGGTAANNNNLAITKSGAGTLTLSGANTFTGNTLVSAGTIKLGNTLALQNSAFDTASVNGGLDLTGYATPTLGGLTGSVDLSSTLITSYSGVTALTLNPQTGTSQIYSGIISNGSGAMPLTKSGAGTQALSGANTYTGGTAVNDGTLTFRNTNAKPSSGTITVASGATLGLGVATSGIFYTAGDIDSLFAGTLSGVTNDATSNVGIDTTQGDFTYATSVSGSPTKGLSKLGGNTLTLSGTNTFTGVTTFREGILSVATIGNGGVAGNLGQATNAAINLVFDGGTLQYTGANATSDRAFTINAGKTATIDTANNISFAGGTGTATTGALVKSGAGILTLNGANTYTGSTAVSAGTLVLNGATNATSGVAIGSGAFLELKNASGTLFTNTFALTGAGTLRTTGGTNLGNVAGTISLGSGALVDVQTSFNGGSGIGTKTWTSNLADLNVASGATFDTSAAAVRVDAVTGSGIIRSYSGSAGGSFTFGVDNGSGTFGGAFAAGPSGTQFNFTKLGTGTQILSGSGNYTSTMNVNGGVLALSGSGNLGAATAGLTLGGGQLDLGGLSPSAIGAVSVTNAYGSGDTITNGSLTGASYAASNTGGTAVISANLLANASAGFAKSGAGNATLSGTNTYTGGTTLTTGTLQFSKLVSMPGSGAVAVGTGATLAVNVGGTGEWTTDTSGAGTIGGLLSGSGGQTGGTVNYTGAITLGLDTVNAVGAQDYTGTIANVGTALGITKLGAGILALSGPNTYTGITTINGDTLSANTIADATSSSIGLSALANALTFGSNNGTLNFTGATGATTRAITFTGQGTFDIAGSSALTVGATGTGVATATSGLWTGNGGIVKSGFGNLTVRNNGARTGGFVVNSITGGALTVQAGILNISPEGAANGAHGAIGDSAGNAGVFNLTGGAVNFAPLNAGATNYFYVGITSNGSLNVTGGTFTANSTKSGGIQVARASTGILSIGGGSGAALVDTPLVNFGQSSPGTGTLNLYTNGTLLTGNVTITSGTNTANFDGGTLKAKASTTTFMSGLTTAAITANGLTVDTNTFNVTIAQSLSGTGGNLTKSGTGNLTLTGASSYTGSTSVNEGKLVFDNASNATSGVSIASGAFLELKNASATLFANSGGFSITGAGTLLTTVASGTNNFGNVAGTISLGSGALIDVQKNFNGGSGTGAKSYAGNLADLNVASGATFYTANAAVRVDALSGSGIIDNSSGSSGGSFTFGVDNGSGNFGGILTTTAGSNKFNFTKSGTGTQILSGSSNYTSTMTVGAGTLQVNAGGSLGAANSTLVLGTGSAGTIGTVGSLTINENVTVGNMTVAQNTSTTSGADIAQLSIASGKTLTTSGLVVGVAPSASGNTASALTATGGGILTVNGNTTIGVSVSDTNSTTVPVDLSALGAFNVTSTGSGYLRVGSNGRNTANLTLSDTANTINVGTISLGEAGAWTTTVLATLNLGNGTNSLTASALKIGSGKGAGSIRFSSSSLGSVTIGGPSSGTTDITIGNFAAGTQSNTNTSSLLLAGHTAEVIAGAVIVGQMTGTPAGSVAPKALLTFDTGNFTATSLTLAQNSGTGTNSGSISSNVTIGGASANSGATGNLSVSGNVYLASNTNSTAGATGTATGNLTINGGIVSVNTTASPTGGILDNSTSTTGTSSTTLTLAGGTLDLNGGVIGGNGTSGNRAITNLNFQSGTLKNVAEINGGTTGLTKTTGGTLTLAGVNSYSGNTTVSAGTLKVDGTLATSAINVTGGSLLIGANEVINNAATVGLGGGTLGFAATATGASETLGALTLSSNSTLDFGISGTTFTFSGFTPDGFSLAINNWTYDSNHLIFSTDQTDNLGKFSFSNGLIASQVNLGGSSFEIIAIPEPGTILAGALLLGGLAFFERKRMRRLFAAVTSDE